MTALIDKFSKLDHFYRQVKRLTLDLNSDITHNKNIINNQISAFGNKDKHNKILDVITALEKAQQDFNQYTKELEESVYNTLRRREVKLIQESYKRYERMSEDKDFILTRNTLLSKKFVDQIQNQIGKYADWRYPGVDINPADGTFTQKMLGCDPLYCIADDKPVVKAIKANFSNFFATRRLRTYNAIEKLPEKQFGFACSINQFEYMPLDPIKDIVKKVYNLLRPGGIFIFSYNDCGERESLELLDNDWRCYMTKEIIISLVNSLGFDYVNDGCVAGTHSWIVVKAPGELYSIKTEATSVRLRLVGEENITDEIKQDRLNQSLLDEEIEDVLRQQMREKTRELLLQQQKKLSIMHAESTRKKQKAEAEENARAIVKARQQIRETIELAAAEEVQRAADEAHQIVEEQARKDAIKALGQQLTPYYFEDLNENLTNFLEEIRPKDIEGYYGDIWLGLIEKHDPLLIPGNVGVGGQGLADKSASTKPSLIPGYRKKIKNAIKNYFDSRGIL
jgi:SAM-dependent methyltransferase